VVLIVIKDEKEYALAEPGAREKINKYISFARQKVPFYRETIAPGASFERYFEVPLTSEESLSKDPLSFVALSDRVVRATTSGGTSGRRKIIFRTKEDLERSLYTVTKIFRGLGVRAGDRIAILQPFDMWNTGHHAMAAFEKIGALSFPVGLSGTDEYVLWLLEKFKCDTVFSTPSRASLLASMGNKLKFIKRVICTGEPILEAHRKAVREAWDAEIFGTYGTEEFDGVAYECEAHQGYHIVDDDLIVEIADPDLRVPTGGKTGLLVMSKINRTGTVLLRYPVGDIAEVDEAPCRCGSGSPRIILLGRVSETLFLYNGLKITINAVEEAIKSALGTLPLYQLVVQGEKDKESLVLVVQHAPSEETRGRILRSILSSLPDLEEAYTMDKSVDLRVILDSSFSSFFITRRGKLPRVVDRRQKS